jgi:hypothetical protein
VSSSITATAITVDSLGRLYITGSTDAPDFPVTGNAFQSAPSGYGDTFLAIVDSSGSSLLFSTYLGGVLWEQANGIALDNHGGVYLAGYTDSANFPATSGAFQPRKDANTEAFVLRIDTGGANCSYTLSETTRLFAGKRRDRHPQRDGPGRVPLAGYIRF